MLKNKKGSLQDLVLIGVVLLFFGMIVMFGFKFMSELDTQIQGMGVVSDNAKEASTSLKGHYTGAIDNGFLFLAIGLGIATLILAALVRVHPIFIPFFFIGLIIVVFVSGLFSNIYQEAAATTAIAAEADQLTFISTIMGILPLIVAIFGILLMVVMYKTWQVSGS